MMLRKNESGEWVDTFPEALAIEEEAVLKWQYREWGAFFTAFWQAIILADSDNLNRLELAFPEHVQGYRCFAYLPGWWDKVEEKARRMGWQI